MVSVSVALCTCNGAEFLAAQLNSLLLQTMLPHELVICDDCSTDATVSIIKAFAISATFRVRLHQNSLRLGSTRNFEQVIMLCNSEVICLADQDDVWMPNKIERLVMALQTNPDADLAFCDAFVSDAQVNPPFRLEPTEHRVWSNTMVRFLRADQVRMRFQPRRVLLRDNVVMGAASAFRSRIRDLICPIDSTWVHDAWIALLVACTSQIIPVDEPLMLYRRHGTQQIGVQTDQPSTVAKLSRSGRSKDADDLERQILRFSRLETHLVSKMRATVTPVFDPRIVAELCQKRQHLEFRLSAHRGEWWAVWFIGGELLKGRYSRFSWGFRSFGRDVVTHLLVVLGR